MASINRQQVQARISGIYDTAHGAQGTSRGIKDFVKQLARSVDLHRDSMGDGRDFMRDWSKVSRGEGL
jgi:hypothetical protein